MHASIARLPLPFLSQHLWSFYIFFPLLVIAPRLIHVPLIPNYTLFFFSLFNTRYSTLFVTFVVPSFFFILHSILRFPPFLSFIFFFPISNCISCFQPTTPFFGELIFHRLSVDVTGGGKHQEEGLLHT